MVYDNVFELWKTNFKSHMLDRNRTVITHPIKIYFKILKKTKNKRN